MDLSGLHVGKSMRGLTAAGVQSDLMSWWMKPCLFSSDVPVVNRMHS